MLAEVGRNGFADPLHWVMLPWGLLLIWDLVRTLAKTVRYVVHFKSSLLLPRILRICGLSVFFGAPTY